MHASLLIRIGVLLLFSRHVPAAPNARGLEPPGQAAEPILHHMKRLDDGTWKQEKYAVDGTQSPDAAAPEGDTQPPAAVAPKDDSQPDAGLPTAFPEEETTAIPEGEKPAPETAPETADPAKETPAPDANKPEDDVKKPEGEKPEEKDKKPEEPKADDKKPKEEPGDKKKKNDADAKKKKDNKENEEKEEKKKKDKEKEKKKKDDEEKEEKKEKTDCRPLSENKYLPRKPLLGAVKRFCKEANGRSRDNNTGGIGRTYYSAPDNKLGTADEVLIGMLLRSYYFIRIVILTIYRY